MRILIAEDDLTSRGMLVAMLQKAGHELIETVNGLDAWNALQKPDAPRMAILDWMMPGMDGVEVVRQVRAVKTDRPPYLIMLTTKGEKADIVAGLNAGADDYMGKPFNVGELRARVEAGRRIVELQDALVDKLEELRRALAEIRTLRGIVPICVDCKKIRDDAGFWQQVEVYVRDHSEAEFSHALCPDCLHRLYPENAEDEEDS